MVVIPDDGSLEEVKTSVAQVQVNYQTKKLYMVANILKYGSINLIIFYCYIYSGLLDTVGIVIQNSIRLMRNTRFGPQIDRWLEWSVICTKREWEEYRCQMVCENILYWLYMSHTDPVMATTNLNS